MNAASRTSSTAYSGRVTSWWVLLGGAVFVTVWIVGQRDYSVASVVIALTFFGLPFLSATSVRTTAGRNGVVVRFGLFGLPRYRYAMGEIHRAGVVDSARPWPSDAIRCAPAG